VRISVFADGDHGVVVVLDDRRYRPDLEAGETAQYHLSGAIVHIKADGSINAVPALSGLVHLGADPGAQFVALAADVKARLDTLQDAHDTHIHPDPVSGNTGAPTTLIGELDDVAATKVKAT
jgi:phage gp45-like